MACGKNGKKVDLGKKLPPKKKGGKKWPSEKLGKKWTGEKWPPKKKRGKKWPSEKGGKKWPGEKWPEKKGYPYIQTRNIPQWFASSLFPLKQLSYTVTEFGDLCISSQ